MGKTRNRIKIIDLFKSQKQWFKMSIMSREKKTAIQILNSFDIGKYLFKLFHSIKSMK